jgi:predicted porin
MAAVGSAVELSSIKPRYSRRLARPLPGSRLVAEQPGDSMRFAWTTGRTVTALVLALVAARADAAITVGSSDGWNLTIGGFVNGFLVSESGDAAPHPDLYGRASKDSNIRIRTGLLPGLLGFTAAAPEVEGIKTAARVGFYPQINSAAGARTSIDTVHGANVDLRELNFTVDGSFGQVLVGRAIGLYQAKNILTDMSLFGVGVSGPFDNGPTLGHIGIGYLYPSFLGQVRYTSPDLSGAKIAVAILDPASVSTETLHSSPTFEGELSYAGKSGETSYQAWLSGVYQSSKVPGETASTTVTSAGGAGGVGVGFSGLDLLLSGFIGSAIGTTGVINSSATLDADNKARTSAGLLAQATYAIGKAKLGLNYSRLGLTKTTADKASTPDGLLDSRQAITGGIWYDLVPSVKLVAEFTRADLKFADATKQGSNTIGVGGFLFF